MIGRTLITTADERTWPKNKREPVFFLGEWCRRHSRKHIWGEYKAEVATYHWDDREKLANDYRYILKVYERFLVLLAHKLNHIHGVSYSLRYWRIFIGPWLGYFIQILFDRWHMLSTTLSNNTISKIYVLQSDVYEFVPNDMSNFIEMFVEDDWNEGVYSQILNCLGPEDLKVSLVSVSRGIVKNKAHKKSIRDLLKKSIEKILLNYSGLVSKDNDAFFISSYIPLISDFKIQLRLKQFPTIWRSQACPDVQVEVDKRKSFVCDDLGEFDAFSKVVSKLIPMHLPSVYLEGYINIRVCPDGFCWPRSPKFIFTSNSYLSDDIFKQWAAEKTEDHTSLVIGQHGGNFGMTPFGFSEKHQIEISDKWLSWGWIDHNRPQITKTGNLKAVGEKRVGYNKSGVALMVEVTFSRQSHQLMAVGISSQWLDYFNDQQRFIGSLPKAIQKKLMIRLYSHDYGWDQVDRWNQLGYEDKIVLGKKNIKRLASMCRIYISTYNATTYLESLTWNIPTIIFWNPIYWELNEQASSYFEKLKSVGIFHETPESAARQIVKVWDDVNSWWASDDVQEVRKEFCQHYAYLPENPIDDLVSIFQALPHQKK